MQKRALVLLMSLQFLGAIGGACTKNADDSGPNLVPAPPEVEVPVEVTIGVDPTYQLGAKRMMISISVKNVGGTAVDLPAAMGAPLHWLDVDLIGPDGKEIHPRAHAPQIRGWNQKRQVPPGESIVVEQDLKLMKLIEVPGKYQIRARFGRSPLRDVPNYVPVSSPTSTFVVLK